MPLTKNDALAILNKEKLPTAFFHAMLRKASHGKILAQLDIFNYSLLEFLMSDLTCEFKGFRDQPAFKELFMEEIYANHNQFTVHENNIELSFTIDADHSISSITVTYADNGKNMLVFSRNDEGCFEQWYFAKWRHCLSSDIHAAQHIIMGPNQKKINFIDSHRKPLVMTSHRNLLIDNYEGKSMGVMILPVPDSQAKISTFELEDGVLKKTSSEEELIEYYDLNTPKYIINHKSGEVSSIFYDTVGDARRINSEYVMRDGKMHITTYEHRYRDDGSPEMIRLVSNGSTIMTFVAPEKITRPASIKMPIH